MNMKGMNRYTAARKCRQENREAAVRKSRRKEQRYSCQKNTGRENRHEFVRTYRLTCSWKG